MRAILGLVLVFAIAWGLSEDRRNISWRPVVSGIVLQLFLAVLLLRLPAARFGFLQLDRAVDALQRATDAGTGLVFGYLGGGAAPFAIAHPEASFILAFQALPLVLVISALASLLFYWGLLQKIVALFAWVLRRAMGIGGALGLAASVHIFVGMIEAPLLIRPYLTKMSRGELFAVMSVGMAGIAGTMMVIYASLLTPVLPDALGNILIASIVSTPAGLAIAALMVPFAPDSTDEAELVLEDPPVSAMDAIAKGTQLGVGMVASIIAMLIVMVALVALVNEVLGLFPPWDGEPVTLQRLATLIFRPIVWSIGVPGAESARAAELMGTKTILNEFVAYIDLARMPVTDLSPRTRLILTYALCGFANFGSLGIMIGGIGAIAPERRSDVVALGLRSILSGTLATCSSGALAGMIGA